MPLDERRNEKRNTERNTGRNDRDAIIATLFKCTESGDVAGVESLLGADPTLVHEHNPDGLTLLGYAAHFGHTDVVRVLLESGADVNEVSDSGIDFIPSNTALHAAIAGKRNMDVIRLLLEYGARPDILDSNGHSCLHTAAYHTDNVSLIELLIEYGADVNLRSDSGTTALDIALEQGHDAAADSLRSYGT